MSSVLRFMDESQSKARTTKYAPEREWPRVDFIFGWSSDLPYELKDNQVLLTRDNGRLYIQGNKGLKWINQRGGNQTTDPDKEDKPVQAADNVVIVFDESALAGEEPRQNTLYVIEQSGEIKYYDGSTYKLLYSGNAETINGFHVEANVPKDAKFTDTTYQDVTDDKSGLMPPADHQKLKDVAMQNDLKKVINNVPTREDFKTGLLGKADRESVYTKEETDQNISNKVSSISWKQPVASFEEIATTYPNPKKDDIVAVADGNVYRYDGSAWNILYERIEMPKPATTTKSGLLSKEDKAAIDDIPKVYATKAALDTIEKEIPDITPLATTENMNTAIQRAVKPLATQASLDELKNEVDNKQIPDAYSKIESDNRYALATDLPNMNGYVRQDDLSSYVTKNESLSFATSASLSDYVMNRDMPTILTSYLKKSDASATYAPLPPTGKSYVLDDVLSAYVKQADYLFLLNRIATLERQVEALKPKSQEKVAVMGYAKVDESGLPTGDYYGIQEFSSKTNFIYETQLKGTAIVDDTPVRLFSNVNEIKYNGARIKAKEEADLPSIDVATKIEGPFYFLSESFHIYRNDDKVYAGISVI